MKPLVKAQVITDQIHVSRRVRERLREGKGKRDKILTKMQDDVWVIRGPVPLHVDKTRKGLFTMGVILVNDGAYQLAVEDRLWSLPVGAVYMLDGRFPHGVLARTYDQRLSFAFLAWDVPPTMDLGLFRVGAQEAIRRLER